MTVSLAHAGVADASEREFRHERVDCAVVDAGVTRVGGVEDPFDRAVVAREDVEAERAWALVHPVDDGLDGVDLEDR